MTKRIYILWDRYRDYVCGVFDSEEEALKACQIVFDEIYDAGDVNQSSLIMDFPLNNIVPEDLRHSTVFLCMNYADQFKGEDRINRKPKEGK